MSKTDDGDEVARLPREAAASGDSAAVVGVVIAGVLASFVVTGPYAWDTTLLGLLLLSLLAGYGHLPRTRGQLFALSAALGFVLLFVLGRFIDVWLAENGRTWLTDWPVDGGVERESYDKPSPSGGDRTLAVWLVLSLLSLGTLRLLDSDKCRRLRKWWSSTVAQPGR